MEGYIKLTAVENGIRAETKIKEVSYIDRLLLLHAFADAIHMDVEELKMAAGAMELVEKLFVGGKVEADLGTIRQAKKEVSD